ncbi:hypothetical protein OBBRIDRAFT_839315 [Obba rivulosa]|uniref:DUF6533 domain-containing protein n=1 Tax=Obba rivulosa TaxID=1052685 RepID=A0A8E2AKD1_9APHY|nr:hypothetical protein OBBRIDRAFT_839315 [Obba rivulosa]
MSYVGSDAAAAELAEVVSILHGTFITTCCGVASGALVLYDHSTTLSKEARFIWGRKFNSVTLLFHLNRWATFALAAAYILGAVNWMTLQIASRSGRLTTNINRSCMPVGILQLAADVILYFVWAAFSAIRIYAVSGGNAWLSAGVCALAAVPACLNIYDDAKTSFLLLPLPLVGTMCVSGSDLSQSEDLHRTSALTIAARTCLIAADAIVLVVTWVKTYWTMRAARSSGSKAPLADMLLRDGTLYFLVLLILNVLHIAGTATNVFVYTTMFTTPISSIIISHFLMNLRETAAAPATTGVASDGGRPSFVRTQLSDLRFASFVGNMGAPLDHSSAAHSTSWLDGSWGADRTVAMPTDEEGSPLSTGAAGGWDKDLERGMVDGEQENSEMGELRDRIDGELDVMLR